MLGITVGYHRMLTHDGFRASGWLRGLILICGCTSFETDPATWAAMHIKHHAHSDEDDDPHSPLHGFWHAHMGWLFTPSNYLDAQQYAPHLLQDRVVMFVSRTWFIWAFLGLIIPGLIGGWTGFVWGGLVRLFLVSHVTYSVNSICHTFGKRHFETTDESRNEWIVGLLAFGEGWHNNHHAFPRNAFHGMRWWQFDLSGLIIRSLERVGLVWDVQRVSPETEHAQRTRMQSMRDGVGNMRLAAMSSLAAMRDEIASLRDRVLPEQALSDAQWAQCEAFRIEVVRKLDAMRLSIAASAHIKRQKLLQYQKDAQKLYHECKQRWSLATLSASR
ncbi:MAG: acyl-CoA desaturase [Candidatus Peribacteraceae bacterium]|nr:acyl-CoA desaturase [Candidatus Peribacteraceae bacterium]